jgi:membrane protein DedA with SNARE-associated domain
MFKGRRLLIVALFVALNIAGVVAFVAFDLRSLTAEPERFVDMIEASGRLAPAFYIVSGTLANFVFLNGPAVWAAPSLFSLPLAYAYALVITLGGSFLAYALAWLFGHDAVQRHVPPQVRRFENRMEQRPLTTLLILRGLLWANPLVDVFIAVSNVSPVLYLGTSIVMLALTTGIQIAIGMAAVEGFEAAGQVPLWAWAGLAAAAVGLFAAYRAWAIAKRRARRHAEALRGDTAEAVDADHAAPAPSPDRA